ncbi:MAG: aminotransferase class V-fold PLP-dependent enzyme, partial [Firmicutes bacterium]|nr:aminotransferase class V-fold PLP-dependent enzyme [Bacillota bacterium]
KGILFMVDGAQGAGTMDLDVEKLNINLLAFPGHKGLLGPLGTGALYVAPDIKLKHIMEGGTGTESKSRQQPWEFPEGYEAGTINAPAIIGLGYSAEFVEKIGIDVIGKYEEELISWLDHRFDEMEFVERYGPVPCKKTGISLINIKGMGAEELTSILNSQYGIAVRGGFHCAGLAHKTIGTWDRGAVRISIGPFNTFADMEKIAEAVRQIGKGQSN